MLKEFYLRAAQSFRASWTDGGVAKKKKQERLTGFFWFCIRAGWLTSNPTDRLGRISVTRAPTDYFTRDEYEKLLDATYLYREGRGETIGGTNGTRIRALIMLMGWSGVRIRDAVTLERTRLINAWRVSRCGSLPCQSFRHHCSTVSAWLLAVDGR